MQPRAKSEASASIVRGRSGWKCGRMGANVKASWRARKATSASEDQLKLAAGQLITLFPSHDLPVPTFRGSAGSR